MPEKATSTAVAVDYGPLRLAELRDDPELQEIVWGKFLESHGELLDFDGLASILEHFSGCEVIRQRVTQAIGKLGEGAAKTAAELGGREPLG